MILVNEDKAVIASGNLTINVNKVYKDDILYIGRADGLLIVDAVAPEIYADCLYKYVNGAFEVIDEQLYISIVRAKNVVPQSITDLQARLVLAQIGRLAEVEAMAAADPTFYIWFDRALEWERTNPYVVNAGLALGLTDTQLDKLFILAATL